MKGKPSKGNNGKAAAKDKAGKGFFARLLDKLDEKVVEESRKECCCKGKCK